MKLFWKTLHRSGYIENYNSGWLDFSNLKVFVEFSADENGLNCGLDSWAEVCETFFHDISWDLIFKCYDNLDGGCALYSCLVMECDAGLLSWNPRIPWQPDWKSALDT